MKKIRKEIGITLIALIITIVILLILAVVAIGAIQDGKIIAHAQNAVEDYNAEKEREMGEITKAEALLNKYGGGATDEQVTGDFEITITQTPNGDPVQSVTLTITPTIPESWKHVYTEEERDLAAKDIANYQGVKNSDGTEITTLEQLLIAAANTMEEVTTPFNKDQYEDVQAMLNTMPGVNITTVDEAFAFAMTAMELNYTTVQEWATDICGYKPTSTVLKIREKGGDWKDVTGNAQWDNLKLSGKYEAPLAETYEIQLILDDKEAFKTEKITYFYLGKYVKYDANGNGSVEDETILWRVLYDDDKVELITADALGEIDLTPENFDDARYKYNNIVDILVEKCKEVTGITENIRSIGMPEIDPIKDDNTVDFEKLAQNGHFYPTVSLDTFDKYEGLAKDNGIKVGVVGESSSDDEHKMIKADIIYADNKKSYFVAWRWQIMYNDNTYSDRISFSPFTIISERGIQPNNTIFEIFSDGSNRFDDLLEKKHSVRPVLTLEAGVLDNSTQSGTKDDVIEIYQNK